MTRNIIHRLQHGIGVFRSFDEIPFVSFPIKLESMLLGVCSRGEVSALVDVIPRTLHPATMMVLRPGHVISKLRTSSDFEGFFIVVEHDTLAEVLPALQYIVPYSLHYTSNPIINVTEEELTTLSMIYDMFSRQLTVSRPFSKMSLNALCEVLFYNALGIYASRLQHSPQKSRREELLMNFIDLLESHFREERAVNFYAERLFVTPKHLSAVLKEISGQTAGEWIDQRVILEAKLLLRTTGMNIQEISTALNFSNQSFFGKYFKHLTGISPREYRTKLSES